MIDKNIILSYLENDAHLNAKTLAVMLGVTEEEISRAIAELEQDGTILSYKTIVNWEKTDRRMVRALIELKTIPQRDKGFDAVAERVSKYDEVKSVEWWASTFCVKGRGATLFRLRDDIAYRED